MTLWTPLRPCSFPQRRFRAAKRTWTNERKRRFEMATDLMRVQGRVPNRWWWHRPLRAGLALHNICLLCKRFCKRICQSQCFKATCGSYSCCVRLIRTRLSDGSGHGIVHVEMAAMANPSRLPPSEARNRRKRLAVFFQGWFRLCSGVGE